MATLNLENSSESDVGYNYFLMPDGQPHIRVANTYKRDGLEIICSLTSMNDLGKLMVAADATKNTTYWRHLVILYFLGARQDRVIPGEALTVKLIADVINGMGFTRVNVLHPHSDAVGLCLDSYEEMDHTKYVEQAIKDFSPTFLIIPDAGAAKNAQKYNKFGLPQVQCLKQRDTKTGELSGFMIADDAGLSVAPLIPLDGGMHQLGEIEIRGRGLIVDDLVDGGKSFTGIAKLFPHSSLALYNTHGVYSKGFKELNKYFDKMYCTNSYRYNGLPIEMREESHKLMMYNVYSL